MATKKRKVYFYRLNLIHHRDIDKNTVKKIHLTNVEIEKKFQYIYDKKTSILSSGRRAISVNTLSGEYVVEILSFSNQRAIIKIGQQNPANTVALRDTSTLETEDVPMSKTQMLELFTFALIDFETCIVSYIGINGAPKIAAIRNLFDNNLSTENTYATLAVILSRNALETLFKKKIISKVTLTIAVPEDRVLRDIGVSKRDFDDLKDVKTSTATYSLVAKRNKNIFIDRKSLIDWISEIREKYGDNLKKMSVNAKNYNDNSETYDLLQANLTKTVILESDENIYPTQKDYLEALEDTYNRNIDELILCSRN